MAGSRPGRFFFLTGWFSVTGCGLEGVLEAEAGALAAVKGGRTMMPAAAEILSGPQTKYVD